MKITKENIDKLNAVLKIDVKEEDYKDKVETILKDYRQKANIPGFRKGKVPMSLIKKQYSTSVMVDEVNKLLQDAIHKFITEEKLDILGNPLPKHSPDFSWDNKDLTFEFELGLAPEFDIDLAKKEIINYKITAEDKMIEDQIINIREQYGKLKTIEEVTKEANITGTFVNEEKEINKKSTFKFDKLKGKSHQNKVLGKKVGDVVTLKTKNLFEDDHFLQNMLGINHDDAHGLEIEVTFTIDEITETELAKLGKDLYTKLFGEDVVKTKKDLIAKLKEDAEKQFEQQSDQQLLNAVTESLIENTKFDLPSEFLQKWMAATAENPMTTEESKEQYEKAEKGLRYQLIEGKIAKDNNLQVTYDELKDYAKTFIKAQMAQYGNMNPSDEDLEGIAQRIMTNKDEVKRLEDQLVSKKLLDFYKENAKLKTKEISFDDFIKEVYK